MPANQYPPRIPAPWGGYMECPPVLNLVQAASYLGVDVKTVRALLSKGAVPGRKTSPLNTTGGRWLIPKEGLDEWLMSGGNCDEQ